MNLDREEHTGKKCKMKGVKEQVAS